MEAEAEVVPNRQGTLNELPTELRCGNFVTKHRLSIQVGAKRAIMCMQRVHIPTELPFCVTQLVVGCDVVSGSEQRTEGTALCV